MKPDVDVPSSYLTFIFLFCAVYLYRVIIDTVNGVSSTKATLLSAISLKRGSITAVKFVEDGTLMLLLSDLGNVHLLSFPYIPNTDTPFHPNYIRLGDDGSETSATSDSVTPPVQVTLLHLANGEQDAEFVRHTFPQQEGMEPVELEVNGRKGRRVVCVLYADGLRYSVFDMDSSGVAEEEEEAGDGNGEMEVEDKVMSQ